MRCSSTKQSLHPARISSCNNHTVMMLTWERMCLHQDRPAPGVRWGAGRASSSGGCGTCDTAHTAPDSLSAPCQQTAHHITKSHTIQPSHTASFTASFTASLVHSCECMSFHFFTPFFLIIASFLPSFMHAHIHVSLIICHLMSCNDHSFSAHVSIFEFVYLQS